MRRKPPSRNPEMVALVSNVAHYSYTARALSRAGRLAAFITSWCLLEDEPVPKWLPELYQRKLESRRHMGLPRAAVHRCYSPELISKLISHLGYAPYIVTNSLFDNLAKRRLQSAAGWRVLHFVYGVGLACAKLGRSRGATVVCDARHEHPSFVTPLMEAEANRWGLAAPSRNCRYLDRLQAELECSDHMVVPSEYAKGTFVSYGFSAERIHVVPYGADLTRFSAKPRPASKTLRLLFVGGMNLRKGLLYLLDAIARLNTDAVELTCVGNIAPAISRLIEKHPVKFIHHPTIPNCDLPSVYQAADLMVLPSLADAYALVVLEALATGTPVVTTTSNGSSELVSDGVNGFVVPPANAEALAAALARFLDEPSLVANMSRAASLRSSRLSWQRYEADIQALYAAGLRVRTPDEPTS